MMLKVSYLRASFNSLFFTSLKDSFTTSNHFNDLGCFKNHRNYDKSKCRQPFKSSTTALTFHSRSQLYMKTHGIVLTFESVDRILWFDHSNETSSAAVLHGTIRFSIFYEMQVWIFLEFWYLALLAVKELSTTSAVKLGTPLVLVSVFTLARHLLIGAKGCIYVWPEPWLKCLNMRCLPTVCVFQRRFGCTQLT